MIIPFPARQREAILAPARGPEGPAGRTGPPRRPAHPDPRARPRCGRHGHAHRCPRCGPRLRNAHRWAPAEPAPRVALIAVALGRPTMCANGRQTTPRPPSTAAATPRRWSHSRPRPRRRSRRFTRHHHDREVPGQAPSPFANRVSEHTVDIAQKRGQTGRTHADWTCSCSWGGAAATAVGCLIAHPGASTTAPRSGDGQNRWLRSINPSTDRRSPPRVSSTSTSPITGRVGGRPGDQVIVCSDRLRSSAQPGPHGRAGTGAGRAG
jgi:hypothetical protein